MLEDHIGVSTWRERAWADGPAWQRNAADHVEHVVAGLAELDVDDVAVPFTASTMRQVIGTLLDTPVRRRGDAAGAVSIADIGGAVCLDAKHVFVVGVNEGVLPATATDDLLLGRDLPDAAADVIEGPRARASRAERVWNSLLRSDAAITATFARTDLRRGGEVYPSPLLVGVTVERHESHAEGLINGQPLTTSEHLAREDDAYLHSARLARRVDALRARLNPQPTEFDGIVGPHPSLAPPGKIWAITALERQAECGLGYFGQYVLGLSDEADPAAILSIEPAQRGSLVHAVFERVALEWLALDVDNRPAWLQGDHLVAAHQRAVEVLDQLAADIGSQHRLGHKAAWAAERVHILQSIAAALDAEAKEGCQPVAGEHSFSGVEVGGVAFRGKIDRIDLMPDGGLRVTDFKTGKVTSINNPLSDGQRLQLPLYARAADYDRATLTDHNGGDWPTATARYLQVREATVKETKVALDAALIGQFEGYIKQWLDEIAAGLFSPQPHAPRSHCLMCCVDSLGVEELAERARQFGGRAGDPGESVE
jgi:RecB family exonuclease